MKRFLRWIGGTLLAAFVVLAGLYAFARMRGPSPEQRDALAMMQRQPPQGRNAFTVVWLLEYNVPASKMASVLAEDRRAYSALSRPEHFEKRAVFESVAAQRYGKWNLDDEEEQALECHTQGDCLARVAEDPERYRRLVVRHSAVIARIRSLAEFDHSRSVWPTGEVIPAYRSFIRGERLALIEDHLDFAAGQRTHALTNVCRAATGLRRLMRSPEDLIDAMIFRVSSRDLSASFAQMLAAMPVDEPLPDGCAAAFAPATAQELSLCEVSRGEFAFLTTTMAAEVAVADQPTGVAWRDALHPLLHDVDNTHAQVALRLARACSNDVSRQIAQDRRVRWPAIEASPWRLECLGNVSGCWAMAQGAGVDESYQHRMQDFAAEMRLIGSLLWLREQNDLRPLAQRLRALPPNLRSGARPIEVTDDGRSLRVRMYDEERHGEYWTVPSGRG